VLTGRRPASTTGDDTRQGAEGRGRGRLSPGLQIPKNRSTGNLGAMGDSSEKTRIRFSFDAGAAAVEYDSMSRSASGKIARGDDCGSCLRGGTCCWLSNRVGLSLIHR
jgi:hypothetical protein